MVLHYVNQSFEKKESLIKHSMPLLKIVHQKVTWQTDKKPVGYRVCLFEESLDIIAQD